MVNCLLCEKKFETQRGLFSHLIRVHDVRDQKQRFSLYVIGDFFPLIEKRSWSKAEELLEEMKKENSSTDWMLGYLLALGGMISALKEGGSIEPYIFSLKRCNYQQLQEEQNGFNEFNKLLAPKKDFDAAYFQAWNDLTYYMMNSKI